MAGRVTVELLEALAVTAELVGHDLSEAGARAFAEELAAFPVQQVLGALKRCRRECRHRLTVADVLERLEDGRPSAAEAFALVPLDETKTVVLNDEISAAMGVAWELLRAGDRYAARQAFTAAYEREVARSRESGRSPSWFVSLGTDRLGREGPIMEAVAMGRLSRDDAMELLPQLAGSAAGRELVAREF